MSIFGFPRARQTGRAYTGVIGETPKECVYLNTTQENVRGDSGSADLAEISQVSHYLPQHTPWCSAPYTDALSCTWADSRSVQGCEDPKLFIFSVWWKGLKKSTKYEGKKAKNRHKSGLKEEEYALCAVMRTVVTVVTVWFSSLSCEPEMVWLKPRLQTNTHTHTHLLETNQMFMLECKWSNHFFHIYIKITPCWLLLTTLLLQTLALKQHLWPTLLTSVTCSICVSDNSI